MKNSGIKKARSGRRFNLADPKQFLEAKRYNGFYRKCSMDSLACQREYSAHYNRSMIVMAGAPRRSALFGIQGNKVYYLCDCLPHFPDAPKSKAERKLPKHKRIQGVFTDHFFVVNQSTETVENLLPHSIGSYVGQYYRRISFEILARFFRTDEETIANLLVNEDLQIVEHTTWRFTHFFSGEKEKIIKKYEEGTSTLPGLKPRKRGAKLLLDEKGEWKGWHHPETFLLKDRRTKKHYLYTEGRNIYGKRVPFKTEYESSYGTGEGGVEFCVWELPSPSPTIAQAFDSLSPSQAAQDGVFPCGDWYMIPVEDSKVPKAIANQATEFYSIDDDYGISIKLPPFKNTPDDDDDGIYELVGEGHVYDGELYACNPTLAYTAPSGRKINYNRFRTTTNQTENGFVKFVPSKALRVFREVGK